MTKEMIEDGFRAYEVMLVLDPMKQEEINQTLEWFENFLNLNKVKVEKFDKWGEKPLAYPIRKRNQGYFVLSEFWSIPEIPKKLEEQLRLRQNVMRYLVIRREDKEKKILNPDAWEKKKSKKKVASIDN